MGVSPDCNLLTEVGSQKKVERISAKAVSNLSKYSIASRQLRYEHDLAIYHSNLCTKLFYPEQRMSVFVTEEGYEICVTDDVLVLTPEGWKEFGKLAVGDEIYVNGNDVPPYMDEEALRALYVDGKRTQKEVADLLGVSERTIRFYVHKFGLEKGIGPKLMGSDNPRWKGDDVSKRGGYDRTHELTDRMKTGVCSKCGRRLPTQIHHDDRNPVNIDMNNLMELCDLCHAMEHHGMVIKWVRPSKIAMIRYGGVEPSLGFRVKDGENVVVEGFIVRFPDNAEKTINIEAF